MLKSRPVRLRLVARPFGPLRFLYVGTSDTGRDAKWFTEVLGARQRWRYQAFGADVAAVDVPVDGGGEVGAGLEEGRIPTP